MAIGRQFGGNGGVGLVDPPPSVVPFEFFFYARCYQSFAGATRLLPTIPDSALSASNSWDKAHSARCSRMSVYKPDGCYSTAWSKGKEARSWIQVAFNVF